MGTDEDVPLPVSSNPSQVVRQRRPTPDHDLVDRLLCQREPDGSRKVLQDVRSVGMVSLTSDEDVVKY